MSDLSAADTGTHTEPGEPGASGSGSDRTLWGDVRYELVRNPVFWFSAVLVVVIMLMAFFPQLFASTSPNASGACQLQNARVTPTWDKPFGYTAAGCDMWSSLVYGTGKSVIVAILVTIGIVIIGVISGTAAGWYGGFTDTVISRITDVFFGLPFILGALVFLAIFPVRNIYTISAVLIVFGWTSITRVMRGSVISTKQRDYVDAARALGAGDLFIIRKHILANSIAPVIVLATISLGSVIGAEATLTFLGVGYQRPTVSWGLLVNEGQTLALAGFPHLLVYPCAFIVITVLAFILLGDVLRDALDPRTR
ncbi:ABC transporter permease [Nocardioides euryhalodurans]|uniref:ABC transporter permease n=1 Tax=Nocardioides euryhalodurans TaxID=2518370 RepID=A0A4P7GPB7_9ACTN|nr:ABC transporter permease [Nocardioides euryhalodurans]QBR94075.1 ABC transporter permease [Nocardioides euryhalodurans]